METVSQENMTGVGRLAVATPGAKHGMIAVPTFAKVSTAGAPKALSMLPSDEQLHKAAPGRSDHTTASYARDWNPGFRYRKPNGMYVGHLYGGNNLDLKCSNAPTGNEDARLAIKFGWRRGLHRIDERVQPLPIPNVSRAAQRETNAAATTLSGEAALQQSRLHEVYGTKDVKVDAATDVFKQPGTRYGMGNHGLVGHSEYLDDMESDNLLPQRVQLEVNPGIQPSQHTTLHESSASTSLRPSTVEQAPVL